jgi:hypothetical protein
MTAAVQRKPAPDEGGGQSDADRDALHILPLAILPVKHPALRRTRLVKNSRLESMVEMFAMEGAGSGHMAVPAAARALGLADNPPDPDLVLLRKISHLPSFDVYSLRVLLRGCDVHIADDSALRLSATKMESLNSYMATFTRPLVAEVFGEQASVGGFTDLVSMMRNCPAETVRERLAALSDKLGIEIGAIPKFLEDYADIFMSLSYYRQCLDEILPPMEDFMKTVTDLRGNFQMKQDVNLLHILDMVEETINALTANVTGRLESFERSTGDMWRDLTAERFMRIETMIKGCHTNIGGVLCALSVKLHAWQRLFPKSSSAGPMRRAEFIMSEMRQGIDTIRALEDSAPVLSELQP